ncbi:threonine/serine ThrE exporter family protein [Nocardia grenadensis]|uniref:threonine/serine ThrE exporter family protein n=1 Tax=Nocardia grenadensis TaxID=931537 RepID=UPI003D7566AE
MAAQGILEGATSPPPISPDPTGYADSRRNPLRLPVLTGAIGKLVADRPATADTIVSAPAPLQPIDLSDDAAVAEVLDLAVRMGEVVLASGSAVTDTETTVRFIAATYGLSACDVEVTYNAIRIYAHRGARLPSASSMRVVQYRSLDFTRLAAVDRLTRRIRRDVVPPDEARRALDAITTAPHPYKRWTATFGWSLMAAAISLLLGGGFLVAALSFVTTAVIDRTNRALNRRGLPFFFQHLVGGAIAAVPAVVLAAFAGPLGISVSPTLIIAAGITVLLSGLSLVGSVQDAITGAPITAAARMLELLMMTGGIIAGIALTLRIGEMFDATVPLDLSPGHGLSNLPVQVAAGAVASLAFALACYAERRALAAAAGGGAMGTICYLMVITAGFGPVVAAGAAAVVVGLVGGLFARRALTPPLVVALAGITPLLPGLSIYRGLYGLLNDELARGANQLLAAFGIGCALAGGVTLGEWFDRTVRRPPILRKFGNLRRPVVKRKRRPAVNLGTRRPTVNLGKRKATPPGRHPIRVPVQHPAPVPERASSDLPLNLPVAGQLPQVPRPTGRGTAPVPEFDRGGWTHDLDAAPLGVPTTLPDAAPATVPADMLEMPQLPADLVGLPTAPLGVTEDILPTEAMPILLPPEPAGPAEPVAVRVGEPVGVGAAEARLAPTEPLPAALRPDVR